MENVQKWEDVVSDLTNGKIGVIQAEIQEGLERAMKANMEKAKRGRVSTRPNIQLSTIRRDRERISPIRTRRSRYRDLTSSSDWIDEYNRKYK